MGLTYILIKPEAIKHKHVEEIKRDILDNGFEILEEKEVDFTYDVIRKIWPAERLNYSTEWENRIMSVHIPYIYFGNFGIHLKARALLLHSEGDAIEKLVKLCGPMDAKEYTKPEFSNTLRGKYGLGSEYTQKITMDHNVCEWCFNRVHRPKTEEEFDRESKIFF